MGIGVSSISAITIMFDKGFLWAGILLSFLTLFLLGFGFVEATQGIGEAIKTKQ